MSKRDWKKVAQKEFDAMEKEWQEEWQELRDRVRQR